MLNGLNGLGLWLILAGLGSSAVSPSLAVGVNAVGWLIGFCLSSGGIVREAERAPASPQIYPGKMRCWRPSFGGGADWAELAGLLRGFIGYGRTAPPEDFTRGSFLSQKSEPIMKGESIVFWRSLSPSHRDSSRAGATVAQPSQSRKPDLYCRPGIS